MIRMRCYCQHMLSRKKPSCYPSISTCQSIYTTTTQLLESIESSHVHLVRHTGIVIHSSQLVRVNGLQCKANTDLISVSVSTLRPGVA